MQTQALTKESTRNLAPQRADKAPRSGVLAALWIPFDEQGHLKTQALAAHLNWLKSSGIHGVLALGSTGEFIRMTLSEREEVLAKVIELASPLPVIANLSSIRLDDVVALGRKACALGAAGVSLMTPHFYPLSQADILEFFLRSADAVDLPFYLYNFPELTGNRIDIETVAAFADHARMAGIKQSGGEFSYHKDLIRLGCEKDFAVFSGSDTRLQEVFELGAAGAIGGLVNFVPDLMVQIFNVCHEGKPGDWMKPAQQMLEVGRTVDQLTFPLNVACGLAARGFDPGCPKMVTSYASMDLYQKVTASFKQLFAEWKLPPAV